MSDFSEFIYPNNESKYNETNVKTVCSFNYFLKKNTINSKTGSKDMMLKRIRVIQKY